MQWEYWVDDINRNDDPDIIADDLNEMGDSGWELVGFDKKLVIFKRPKSKLKKTKATKGKKP